MHIWDDQPSSIMHHKLPSKKMDYSHCPLKKRPVHFVKCIKEEMDFVDNTEDYAEPENLSTKPQDLSVKCKSTTGLVTSDVTDVKKESPSLHQNFYHHHQQQQSVIMAPTPSPYHHQPQHPYQPTAVKPGPLEPLCLNISGDHHPTTLSTAAAYHHHHRHYAPATPRPVPAQYPATGYLAGYVYHHGGLVTERAFPSAVYPGPMAATVIRDSSLSPPGSSGTGSAFKPLRSSPSSATTTMASRSPTAMSWYSRNGEWSPSTTDADVPLSPLLPPPPPLQTSLSPVSISPSYGLPPVSYQLPCSGGDSDTSSTATNGKRKPTTNAGRYKCASCSKSYSTMSGLSKHQQYHCSDEDCAAAAAAKTFCCKYCDKAYNTLGALKMHIRTHTLPCICKLCGKAFSRPWLLQGHIRTHTGEKPFSCPHCNRAFADRSNLRAHLQTHSDVKKYSCLTCSKTFSRMSLLTKHCDTGCPRLQPQLQQ